MNSSDRGFEFIPRLKTSVITEIHLSYVSRDKAPIQIFTFNTKPPATECRGLKPG